MILIYNSYVPPGYNYRRVDNSRTPEKGANPAVGKLPSAVPPEKRNGREKPSVQKKSGVLESILPSGIDTGDILLTAVLFLLYIESKDEDFLIILAVIALSILKPQEDEK